MMTKMRDNNGAFNNALTSSSKSSSKEEENEETRREQIHRLLSFLRMYSRRFLVLVFLVYVVKT